MPIYRYQCGACGASSEVWAKLSDAPPTACPQCGGGPLVKAVARTAFHLKGGGWYAQGYGGPGKSETPPAAATPAAPKTETVDKPAEAKPAALEPKPAPKPATTD